jgi:hypothetical protein
MFRLATGVFAVSILTAAIPVDSNAQDVVDWRVKGPKPGTVLTLTGGGRTGSLTIVNKTVFKRSSGGQVMLNDDGNTLVSGNRNFSPHSGVRPPNAKGVLRVGQRWVHNYSVNGVNRRRSCRVVEKKAYVGTQIKILGAYKVRCTNQRLDRSKPMHEEIWFAPNLLLVIDYRASWGTGGFAYHISGIKHP